MQTLLTPLPPKLTLYRFGELDSAAQKKAAQEVYEKECYSEHDWSHEYENTQEYVEEIMREAGLEVEHIYWNENYGVTIDFSEVKMTYSFLKNHLSKEDFEKYEALERASDCNLHEYLFNREYDVDGFHIVFDYNLGFDERETIEFVMKYSKDEEVKIKYRLPALFLNESDTNYELEDDERVKLESDLNSLGISISEELSHTITLALSPFVEKVLRAIKENAEYLGSEQYFYDQLEAECHEEEVYRFNESGSIITKDDEFLSCEDEDKYELYSET